MLHLLPIWWIIAVIVLWGAVWGSFANVVIARVPAGQSVVAPASHCMACGTPIRWFDNIPIVSWLVLRGRCRRCGARISARYPLVEAGGVVCSLAAAWAASGGAGFWRFGHAPIWELTSVWMLLSLFLLVLMMLTLIDLEHLLLPHRLTITLVALAFIYAYVVPVGGEWRGFVPSMTLWEALIGFVVAYGGLFLFATAYALLRGRQGIGGGDFMLFGALGAWFGWEALPIVLLLAAFQGVVCFGLALLFAPSLIHTVEDGDSAFWDAKTSGNDDNPPPESDGREDIGDAQHGSVQITPNPVRSAHGVPFGPFLCLAAVEFLAFGALYFRWLNGAL